MLTAVIVDDESSSRNALRKKINHYCSAITVIGECEGGEQAIPFIQAEKPQLVFLDVEMPRMNGFTMLQQVHNRNFEVIFVTAYDHYAVQAIRLSALDYLIKPVEVEDLKRAVARAIEKNNQLERNERLESLLQNLVSDKKGRRRIAVPSMDSLSFIELSSILYFEASSNYTIIHRENGAKVTVTKTLKNFEDLLPGAFVRIHHAYIINCEAVDKYIKGDGGQVVMKNGIMLDISKRKRAEFLRAMNI